MWKLHSVCPVPPWALLSPNVNNNRNPVVGWGWGIWFSSVYIGHFAFFPRSVQKASEKKTAAHHMPFLCPGLGEPWCMFSPNEDWIWAASACFYLFLTDSHKADIPLCWAKRMLNSEVGASGACWTDFSLTLTLSYNQHFPEIDKSLQGYMNLRLRRETLIKQLNCQSEVTLKVSLFERKHNGAIFMLTIQSHAWPVGPTAALARMAYNASSSWRAWG